MVIIHFSSTLVQATRLSKKLFGALTIESAREFEYAEGAWSDRIKDLAKKEDAFITTPDAKSFLHRFEFDPGTDMNGVNDKVLEKVAPMLPVSLGDVSYDIGIFQKDETSPINVLFVAAPLNVLFEYYKGLNDIGASPVLAVPESLAVYEIIQGKVAPGEIVAYINFENDHLQTTFFDKLGPLTSVRKQTSEEKVMDNIKKIVTEFKKDYEKEVKVVFIGGAQQGKIDTQHIRSELEMNATSIDWLLKDKLDEAKIKYKGEALSMNLVHIIGTSLFTVQKNPLNLLKVEALEEYGKNPRPIALPEEKEDEKPKKKEEKETKKEKDEEKDEEKTTEHVDGTASSPTPFSGYNNDNEDSKGSGMKKWILIIVGLIVGAGIGLVVIQYFGVNLMSVVNRAPEPTPTPVAIPTPTPLPEADRSEIKLQVLNGSGESGVAAGVAGPLEEKGYPEIDTGNADNYDYTGLTIQIGEDTDLKTTLLKDLGKEEADVTFEELPEDSEFSAVIIVGK